MKRRNLTSDQASVRDANLSTVLYHLQKGPAISRAGLANLTGLNKTTISSLAEELLDRGLIHEVGLAASGGGRPGRLLTLNPQAGHLIGLELDVDFISVNLTDFIGQPIWQRTIDINPTEPQDEIINCALSLIDKAKAASEVGSRILGVGVTLPGLVNVEKGILLFSPNLRWHDVSLRHRFEEYTRLPVFVENDANAATLGEHLFGQARQTRDFIFISLGIGVGSGLFLNGDLYRGGAGVAGEIGHSSLMTEWNRPCYCGKRGCWETASNQYALIERIRALLAVGRQSIIPQILQDKTSPLTLSIIYQAAEADDEVALEALAETGQAIGLGIAHLINIINPEMIVIGGPMSKFGDYLLPAINKIIEQQGLLVPEQQTKIVMSGFKDSAIVMGAIALVVKDILMHPTHVEPLAH